MTCANLCPVGAIEFPSVEVVRKIIRDYKVFIKVKESLAKNMQANWLKKLKNMLKNRRNTLRPQDSIIKLIFIANTERNPDPLII